MAQVTHFFAGANSGDGFQNLFSEIVDLEDTYDLMVLKGGPGVGKATFMREIGRSMEEAGTPVEYLWCSGDPDSLYVVYTKEATRIPWTAWCCRSSAAPWWMVRRLMWWSPGTLRRWTGMWTWGGFTTSPPPRPRRRR